MKNKYLWLVISIFLIAGGFTFIYTQGNHSGPLTKETLSKELIKLHIPFIENQGQTDKEVKYYAKTFSGDVFVTDKGEIVYSIPEYEIIKQDQNDKQNVPQHSKDRARTRIKGHTVFKETLLNAKVDSPSGMNKSQTKVNYFIGNDPKKHKNNIPTFNLVNLGEVYEGIDLKLKAYGSNVEKLFYVKPGANPDDIQISVKGMSGIWINDKGELILDTKIQNLPAGRQGPKFTRPVAYQEINGKRVEIEAGYKIQDPQLKTKNPKLKTKNPDPDPVYGFMVAKYDNTKTLIIDPLLASTFLGDTNGDRIHTIIKDSSDNIYVAGYTSSLNYPASGGYDTTHNGSRDVFVSKLNSSLSTLSASTFIGGNGIDEARAIVLDPDETSIYVTGDTSSTNYPASGGYDTVHNDGSDVFVSKLNSDLSNLSASTFIGGDKADQGRAIDIDSSGNVYVAGHTVSDTYPDTTGAYDEVHNGNWDVFVSKLNSSLSTLLASTFIGGDNIDFAYALAIDSSDSVYVTGYTNVSSTPVNYPVTTGAYDEVHNGNFDVYVSKLDSSLSTLSASTFIGGGGFEEGNSIAIASNNIYVTGYTTSSDYPIQGGSDTTHNGSSDVFVSKLNSTLSDLSASTFIGGNKDDIAYALAIDSSENIYVAGSTLSSDYPTVTETYDRSFNQSNLLEAFISKLDSSLSSLDKSTYLGGLTDDEAFALTLDSSPNVYVAGYTDSPDFPVTIGSYDTICGVNAECDASTDAFVSKLDSDLSESPTASMIVNKTGTGTGTVTSSPSGINCGSDCSESYDRGTQITITATADSGSTFSGWTGGGCTGTDPCTITLNSDATVIAEFTDGGGGGNGGGNGGGDGGGGGCFIATAAYGSYLDPHVEVLKDFRDNYLISNFKIQISSYELEIPNIIGNLFVEFYYKYSPPVADFISEHETLRAATRWALTPVVYAVKYWYVSFGILGIIGIAIIKSKNR